MYKLLRKSKTILGHIGFQRYSKNLSWLLVSRLLCMVISFVATAFIARKIGPVNSGQLSYAMSFVVMFSFIPSMGIDTILYRDLVRHKERTNYYLGSALGIKLLASTFTIILVTIAAIVFAGDKLSIMLIFILSLSFISSSFLVVVNEFNAKVASKYPAIVSVIVIFILNLTKVFILFFNKGIIYLALVTVLESVLYSFFYFYLYKKVLHATIMDWKFDKVVAASLLRESWPFIFNGAFLVIYSKIDQVFIKHMIDTYSVGIYDAAVRVAETWYFIPGLIINSLLPALVNANSTSGHLYQKRLVYLFIFIVVFTTLTSLVVTSIAPLIMSTIYGERYMEGVKILQIYIWSSIPTSLNILMSNYLVIEKNRKILLLTSFIPMFINILLNLWWIPLYGIVGSAYATLVAFSFSPVIPFLFKETRRKIFSMVNR